MNLHRAPLSAKIAITWFVVLVFGGVVTSEILVTLSLNRDQSFYLSTIENIKAKYAYPRLHGAILTSMGQYLEAAEEKEQIIEWCKRGGVRFEYYRNIEPIIDRRCLDCHGRETTRADVSLSTWGDLAPLVTTPGMPIRDLASQTHYHLFGIGLLALMAAGLLSATRFSTRFKVAASTMCMLSVAGDISSWWLARAWENAAILIGVFGFTMAASMVAMFSASLYDMWRSDRS